LGITSAYFWLCLAKGVLIKKNLFQGEKEMRTLKKLFLIIVVTLLCFVAPFILALYKYEQAAAASDPSCSIEILMNGMDLKVTLVWETFSPEGWHILDWGDGTDFGFQGLVDERIESHTYQDAGTYGLVFTTDAIDGDEPSCVASVDVIVPQTSFIEVFLPFVSRNSEVEGPFCQITDEVGDSLFERIATIVWSGARNDWWLLYWGDESQTKAEPPGFFGPFGEESFPHVYNSGDYIQTATVESDNGKLYTCTNKVTIP
jgi:hypothetical protein